MIQIQHDMRWSPEWDIKKRNRHVIDLRNCTDERCVISSIGAVLRPQGWTVIAKGLPVLDESVSDWLIERWGDKVEIYLRGVEAIRRARSDLMNDIIDIMNQAIDTAAERAPEEGRDCDETTARQQIKIFFCFS